MESPMRLWHWIGVLSVTVLALAACGGGSTSIGELLPLAEDHPTFVFFYTPN